MDDKDEMREVYRGLGVRADAVIVASPIRSGAASLAPFQDDSAARTAC